MLATRVTIGIAIATGVALELGIHALSGRQEAWDSSLYWIAGLPIAGAVAVVQGALARRRDWLWAFAIVPSQITTMMVRSGEDLDSLAADRCRRRRVERASLAFIGSKLRRLPRD